MSDDSPQTVTEKAAPYNRMRDQDQDKFGEIIKKFPIIWDSSRKHSKNKQLKDATWDEISKIMDIYDRKLIYVVTFFLVSVTCVCKYCTILHNLLKIFRTRTGKPL